MIVHVLIPSNYAYDPFVFHLELPCAVSENNLCFFSRESCFAHMPVLFSSTFHLHREI